MGYRSTAKQRLWLTCLGYEVPDSTEGETAREMFEHASASGRYQDPTNARQRTLARKLGIDIQGLNTCSDAAGKLYHVLLLRAWVYSVWRLSTSDYAANYSQLGLPLTTANFVASEMEAAGLFMTIEQFATTEGREADVFYRMSKSAQASEPYRFVVQRLELSPSPASRPTPLSTQPQNASTNTPQASSSPVSRPRKRRERSEEQPLPEHKVRSTRVQQGSGCMVLLAMLLSGASAFGFARIWAQ